MTLTPHFSFEELTRTGRSELQEANRREARDYVDKLKLVAEMLEVEVEEIRTTVLHETAHYFGLDEDDLSARGLE